MDKKIKVGYQGAHGTFSEIAVQEFFKDQSFEACNYKNFPSIIADVEKGMIDYALLPVENTTTGIIYRTYDLLKDSDIFAVGEILVRIYEHLIGLPQSKIEDLREVYSSEECRICSPVSGSNQSCTGQLAGCAILRSAYFKGTGAG